MASQCQQETVTRRNRGGARVGTETHAVNANGPRPKVGTWARGNVEQVQPRQPEVRRWSRASSTDNVPGVGAGLDGSSCASQEGSAIGEDRSSIRGAAVGAGHG